MELMISLIETGIRLVLFGLSLVSDRVELGQFDGGIIVGRDGIGGENIIFNCADHDRYDDESQRGTERGHSFRFSMFCPFDPIIEDSLISI